MTSDSEDLARIRNTYSRFPEAEQLQDRPLFHLRRRRFAIFNSDAPQRLRWQALGRSLHIATSNLLKYRERSCS